MLCTLVDADPIAVWGLVVAIVGVVVGLVAAVAAIYAAVYAKAAPTKEDLARVENNTAHLEDVRASITNVDLRTKRQEEAGELANRAMFVSITASGQAEVGEPLPVYLTGTEPNPRLTRVEFRSEIGNVFGSAECIPTGNLFQYLARLPSDNLRNWRNAGRGVNPYTTRQMLRVWMRFDEQTREVYRDMAVILNQGQRAIDGDVTRTVPIYKVEGAVSCSITGELAGHESVLSPVPKARDRGHLTLV